jgi:hypothetical protein
MTALRRHLIAFAWTVLSVQAAGLALGTAQACRNQEHTHGGVAAPDCPMHHHTGADPRPASPPHVHQGQAPDADRNETTSVSCRCSNEQNPTVLGQIAILQPEVSYTPFVQAALIGVARDGSLTDLWSSPPSPPPR